MVASVVYRVFEGRYAAAHRLITVQRYSYERFDRLRGRPIE